MATLHHLPTRNDAASGVSFTRGELSLMLGVYSRRVMSGEWRDYAIDHSDGLAMFSVFRDTKAQSLFAIVKSRGRSEETEYMLFHGPERLERSASLADILAALESRPRLVSG